MVDDDGIIAEGSGENFFMVRDGNVLTNDERDHVLMGITRDSVITLARGLRIGAYGVLFALSMALGFTYVLWDENASVESARTVAFFIACSLSRSSRMS